MIAKTATYQVRAEALDESTAALEEFVGAVGANESGTLFYIAFQHRDDPTRFTNFFAFTDADAEARHRTTAWVQAFTDVLYPNTVAGVEFTDHTVIATTV